jgi:hypothetical protein
MVEKVVREELLEQFEITSALDFLGIAADNGLGGIANRFVGHVRTPSAGGLGTAFGWQVPLVCSSKRPIVTAIHTGICPKT